MRVSTFTNALAIAALLRSASGRPTTRIDTDDASYLDDESIYQPLSKQTDKYFKEPGNDGSLSHYDLRYFKGVVDDEERTDTQSHMVRAYLEFFREQGLDTWLAHGTLLGWWWNGKRFPWDTDIDTQVSNATLHRLGAEYNQTTHHYTSPDGAVKREYVIDVNAWIKERSRGDGMNVIDARWIDTRNGLYIDITGLSEIRPDTSPDVWSCKNSHNYRLTDLFPMRTTMFEGVEAKVPYAYDRILVEEYRQAALVRTYYNGYQWEPEQRLWVKTVETLRREDTIRRLREGQRKMEELEQAQLE